MDDERDDSTAWKELLRKIGMQMEILFVLNSQRDKEVWQYIVGLAARLEYYAAAMLWVADDKPSAFDEYEVRMNLGSAIEKIRRKCLLPSSMIETVKDINQLRNSVAHREAVVSGVTAAAGRRGIYRGGNVFINVESLRKLAEDEADVIKAMSDWLRAQGALTT
jgi:hypothetical protein